MVDLHIHTNFSDGTDDFKQILKKAESKHLKYISFTDHDNCNVYKELNKINISQYFSGQIINGIELRTKVGKITIELLGYGIDPNTINQKVKRIYPPFEKRDKEEAEKLVKICKDIGVKIDDNILENYDKTKYVYASTYIHEQITKEEYNKRFFIYDKSWNSDKTFYRKEMTNPNSVFYIDNTEELPTVGEVVDLIHEAGGLVFIPHVYNYGEYSEKIFKYIIQNYKIDGIECYHSKYTQEQSDFLLQYCKQNRFYISGGSDYHGLYKPKIELGIGGGNLKIEENKINPWAKNIYKTFHT